MMHEARIALVCNSKSEFYGIFFVKLVYTKGLGGAGRKPIPITKGNKNQHDRHKAGQLKPIT